MRYFFLVVLLAILQTPIPPKVPDSASDTRKGVAESTNNNKAATIPSPSVVKPVATNPEQNANNTPKPKDERESIRVSELPPVSVTKDWADRGVWVFSGLLVIVGILQFCVLWRQAKIMGEHARHLGNLAIAAKKNAEAAKLTAEAFITESRPWLLLHKDMTPDGPHTLWESLIRVHNFGKTPAKVIAFQIELQIGGSRDLPPQPEFFDRESLFNPFLLPQGEEFRQDFNVTRQEDIKEIAEGRKHLWLCGLVKYQSTFETSTPRVHDTSFCFRSGIVDGRRKWARGPDKYNKAT